MTQELRDLLDARAILSQAYFDTIALWSAHNKVWHAIEYIDKQIDPIITAALEPEKEVAA